MSLLVEFSVLLVFCVQLAPVVLVTDLRAVVEADLETPIEADLERLIEAEVERLIEADLERFSEAEVERLIVLWVGVTLSGAGHSWRSKGPAGMDSLLPLHRH